MAIFNEITSATGLNWVESISNIAGDAINQYLNALYPNDFSAYLCVLELADGNDDLIDSFTFPIMPSQITKSEPSTTNIKKTFGGITVIKSADFIPQQIMIKGNFGRGFKFLQGAEGAFVAFSAKKAIPPQETTDFNSRSLGNVIGLFNFKSGFGAVKYMQYMLNASRGYDTNVKKSRKLYFHNNALGEIYLCEYKNLSLSQDISTNMIWGYDLTLDIIADVTFSRLGRDKQAAALASTKAKILNGALNLGLKAAKNIASTGLREVGKQERKLQSIVKTV